MVVAIKSDSTKKFLTIMRKYVNLLILFVCLIAHQAIAGPCPFVINKTVVQPTCGSNGLISFSTTPAPAAGAKYKVYKDGVLLVTIEGNIANLNSLAPGVYKVIVEDLASGCVDSLSNIVLDPAANALSATYYIDSPRCDTSTNGKIGLILKNANYPVTYVWRKDGTPFTNNDSVVKPALKGTYAVTMTDNSNCRFELANIVVLERQGKLVAIDTLIVPTSCDSPNGRIEVIVTGRHYDPNSIDKNVKMVWLDRPDRDTFNFIDSLPKGKYTVVFTDTLKCYPLVIKDIEVKQNPRPKAYIKGTDTLCPDVGYGQLEVFIQEGDSANMTYRWNQGDTSKKITGSSIIAGDYYATVTDRAGCIDTPKWTIHGYPEKQIKIVAEYKQAIKLTQQYLRIDSPNGLYNIVWSSSPERKFIVASNKDSVIHVNSFDTNTTYYVEANYGPGCKTQDNITIIMISKDNSLKDENIPNIFSPGQLKNSKYHLIGLDNGGGSVKLFGSFEFKVYDRWGNLVFNADREDFVWYGTDLKGEPASNGIYTFIIKYVPVGNTLEQLIKTGTILLER